MITKETMLVKNALRKASIPARISVRRVKRKTGYVIYITVISPKKLEGYGSCKLCAKIRAISQQAIGRMEGIGDIYIYYMVKA